MRDLKAAVVILLLTASLAAGCTGNNSEEDLDAEYQEGYDAGYGDAYDASYDGVAQHHYNEGWDDGWEVANSDSQAEIAEIQTTVSVLEATVSGHETNIAGLEAAIALMEGQRDSLMALLSDSQEFANQTIALAEAMNETIAGLHAMLGENATQVQQLQTDLAEQQDLVAQWQQTAEDNRADLSGADLSYARLSYADLSGANLNGADLSGVSWYYTTCPDGTRSNDNGNTCVNNL